MVAGISNGVVNATFAVHIGWQCPPLSQNLHFKSGYPKTPFLEGRIA